jgi:hypothetical protein
MAGVTVAAATGRMKWSTDMHRRRQVKTALVSRSISSVLFGLTATAFLFSSDVRAAPEAPAPLPPAVCDSAAAEVGRAYRISRGASAPADADKPGATDVELGDEIAVEVKRFSRLKPCITQAKPLMLFLDGRPVKSLKPPPPPLMDRTGEIATFRTKLTIEPRETLAAIVARARAEPTGLLVSVGLDEQPAIRSEVKLQLNPLPTGWGIAWLIIFLALIAAFLWCVGRSNIIRDGQPEPGALDWRGPYSLARTQAAWWFFVVLAAYLFIGLVTGDFSNSFNSTALTLLAIGAGTALGSAAINVAKTSDKAALEEQRARETATQDVTKLKDEADILQRKADAEPIKSANKLTLVAEVAAAETRLSVAKSDRAKLLNQSEGFFRDIVSDANGVSFHRFQVVAWTVVLTAVFVKDVGSGLAMPDFNATLLGLQGLSAATFLGLKTTEPTIPKK